MSEREAGWYWVKVLSGGKWGCFLWNGEAWEGESGKYPDAMFDEVGPRIPTPDEPWQTVPVEPTEKMVRAGISADADGGIAELAIYHAMLAAAPTPGGE